MFIMKKYLFILFVLYVLTKNVFYIPFNIIKVISRQGKGDNERLCAMKRNSHELIQWDLNSGPHDLPRLTLI